MSYAITFITGLVAGILGKFLADRLSDKAKKKDLKKKRKNTFHKIKLAMPDLIAEMISDLKDLNMDSCRIFFVLPKRSIPFRSSEPAFVYYESDHDNLRSKIRRIENAGLVHDITEGNTPKYQFDEEFIDFLIN